MISILNHDMNECVYHTVTGDGETSINFPESVELLTFSGGKVRENSQR